MTDSWDAIVIGGGVNGLVAGACLGRSGRRVLLLERARALGGVARAVEVAPGFPAGLLLDEPGWMPPEVARAVGLREGAVTHLSPDPTVAAPSLDGEWLCLSRDPSRAAEAIRRFSPRDAERWPAFCTRLHRLGDFLRALYALPAPRVDRVEVAELPGLLGLARRFRRLGRADMIELLRTVPMSVQELLDDWFESDLLKAAVGAGGIIGICQGPRSGGTAFVLLHHHVGSPPGAIRSRAMVKGGAAGLVEALRQAAERAGVSIRLGVEVSRVVVRDDRVAGVALASGEEITAPTVLSTADPYRTLLGLLDPVLLDPELIRAVRNIKFRGVTARVLLALDGLPAFKGLVDPAASLPGVLSFGPGLEYLERAYDAAKYGQVSQRPYLQAAIPTLTSPALAPPGKHLMSVQVQYAPYRLREGEWDGARREALGDLVVRMLAEVAPDLPNRITARLVLTTKDIEARFGLTEGAVSQGELTLDQILFMRPVPGWSRYAMPVAGLYLGGAGTHPGPGIAGAPGYFASRQILKDLGR